MKTQTLSLMLLGGIAIFSIAITGCSRSSSNSADIKNEASQHKKVLYWTCAMHPQVHEDHPGKCPICGMTLVPVYQTSAPAPAPDKASDEKASEEMVDMPGMPGMKIPASTQKNRDESNVPTVRLDAAQKSVASVAVSPAKKEYLNKTLSVFGEIKYIQDKHVDFTWVYGGRIEKVLIPYSTTDVQRGQALLGVYSEEAIADEQMYLQAVRDRYLTTFYERKVASAQVELYRQKLLRAGMTEEELNDLIKEKKIKTTFTLTAPISGTIVGQIMHIGERFTPDKELFHLSDMNDVWFLGRVYEQDMASLQLGESAAVTLKAFPDKKFTGSLVFIDRFLDPASRTLEIRLLISNKDKLILPDMSGEALITPKDKEAVLVVPESAIIDTGRRKIVYVQTDPSTYRQREIVVGRKGQLADNSQNYVEIKQGLNEGDKVVATGAFVIDAEAQLKNGSQNEQGEEGHQH